MDGITKLTKALALERREQIEELQLDPEGAHVAVDALWYDFIECVEAKMYRTFNEASEVAQIVLSADLCPIKGYA